MTEGTIHFTDEEARDRYHFVVLTLRENLQPSVPALFDSSKTIKPEDLTAISTVYKLISPLNPSHPWRIHAVERSIQNEPVDPSFFDNWEAEGGPLESMELARDAAFFIANKIKKDLRPRQELSEEWERKAHAEISSLSPVHAAAAALLHDIGRFVTHIQYSEGAIGRRLLVSAGIRGDLIDVLPDENVLIIPLEDSMDAVLQKLSAEAIIVRLADDFGKRVPNTNRLYQPSDFTQGAMKEWAKKYIDRPFSGRPSDSRMRDTMSRHIGNVPRYFQALDKWVRAMTTLTLEDLARRANEELFSFLSPLREGVSFTSNDMLDNGVVGKELMVGDRRIEVRGLTYRGGPNKRFNEDACCVIHGETSMQVFVVDGGTQVDPVPSLGEISGGKYIADRVVEFSQDLDPSKSIVENLHHINMLIGEDIRRNHSEIKYTETSMNIPYGSIAGLKIDVQGNRVEVANAGDSFVLAVLRNGQIQLLTKDDVHEKDQRTFEAARKIARENRVTIREAMKRRDSDSRFRPIIEEMYETIRLGNIGQIRRITGSPNFDVTSKQELRLGQVSELFLFSDGVALLGIDIHTEEGQQMFVGLVKRVGLQGLYREVDRKARADFDFEKWPRFRDIDDGLILHILLK